MARVSITVIVCLTVLLTFGCGTNFGQPRYQPEDVDEGLLKGNSHFAFQLYEEVLQGDEGKNIFLSPLSIATALSMTVNGADGKTREAMTEVLEVQGLPLQDMNRSHAALKNIMEHADPDVKLRIANSLWGREDVLFKEDFIKEAETFYDAEVTMLDFADPRAAATINNWVDKQTKGKIAEIVDQNISPETILFLINAIYFKGEWAEPFDKAATTEQEFQLPDGTIRTVPMMSQSGEYGYYQGDDFEAVQLPYGNGRFSMNIFLPAESTTLEQFHQQLNMDNWREWMTHVQSTQGSIQLPRFQLEYETSLNEVLKALGMEEAFDPQQADFSRMVSSPNNVFIANVKHKSFIEVNEEGSEAAAATVVEMQEASAPADFFSMKVDRPFFFTIQENETGTLLFMGSVVDPQ